MTTNNRKQSQQPLDLNSVYTELKIRVDKVTSLIKDNFKLLTRYFCAILSVCDNMYNQHFAENALNLFCFLVFEIETLSLGYLKFEGQEKLYKGFIAKQTGTFDKEKLKKPKGDQSTRLTLCCIDYLSNMVSECG
jgi:hypothetical protein